MPSIRLVIANPRLYRAFPELDRFDDDRCRRFVKAARRSRIARALHWSLIAISWVLVADLFFGTFLWAWFKLGPRGDGTGFQGPWTIAYYITAAIISSLSAFCAALLIRDVLLRRRISRVIRDRSRCLKCGYSLLDLPIDAADLVACPECGLSLRADAELGEIARARDGTQRYKGARSAPEIWRPRWLTLRFLARLGMAAVALLIAGAIAFGIYSWRQRELFNREITLAKKLDPGFSDLDKLVRSRLPAPVQADAEGAWQIFDKVQTEYDRAETRVQAQVCKPGERLAPDYILAYRVPRSRRPADGDPQAERRDALAMLAALDSSTVYPDLARIAVSDPSPRPIPSGGTTPLYMANLNGLGPLRQLARLQMARMDRAVQQQDFVAVRDSAEATLGLVRMLDASGAVIDRLVSLAVESLLDEHCRGLVMERPSQGLLDALEPAIRGRALPDLSLTLDVERLVTLSSLCSTFAQPTYAQRQTFVDMMTIATGEKGTLGTLEENIAALNSLTEALKKTAGSPPSDRASLMPPPTHLALISPFRRVLAKVLPTVDRINSERQGLLVMIALERYHLAAGEYPTALEQLVPTYLPGLPIDNATQQPLRYVRMTALSQDRFQRGYLLYDHKKRTVIGDPTTAEEHARDVEYVVNAPPDLMLVTSTREDGVLRPAR